MIYFLKGKIALKTTDSLVIDIGNMGYEVYVTHLNDYVVGEEALIYTYQVVREDEQYLAGFSSIEEKEIFLRLITVKGIGPRTALNAMSATTADELFKAISANNTTFLKKLPGIGSKAAQQIILDLKGQLTGTIKGDPNQYDEVRAALKSLGFKNAKIDEVLSQINEVDASNDEILRIALKKLK